MPKKSTNYSAVKRAVKKSEVGLVTLTGNSVSLKISGLVQTAAGKKALEGIAKIRKEHVSRGRRDKKGEKEQASA